MDGFSVHTFILTRRSILVVTVSTLFVMVGCSSKTDETVEDPKDLATQSNEPTSAAEMLAAGMKTEVGKSTFDPARTPGAERALKPKDVGASTSQLSPPIHPGIVGEEKSGQPFSLADEKPDEPEKPERVLDPDLAPNELIQFLAESDQYMQAIYSGEAGVTDQRKAMLEMSRTAQLKLTAARRLKAHPDSDAAAQSEGSRGELQALSHLASQGHLASARELEALAQQNLASDDKDLVADSRIVLIGFAIESLQAGKEDASKKIVQLVDAIEKEQANVPAMMIMGHARQLLLKYGHDEDAVLVRQRIIDLYANSGDPEIARLAAQVAGNVMFDAIEQLRRKMVDGKTVAATDWVKSANQLIDEAPDLVTVQYLAGAALELEGTGNEEAAQSTYDVMLKRFASEDEATGREVKLAIQARDARKRVIGRSFDPVLPSVDGQPIKLADYKGKIVLMPFWASGFPEALQVLPILETLRDEDPDNIAIVGMNLDPKGPQLDQFLAATKMSFRSFHSVSSPTEKVANPVAAQFGMVSMPFVAILDQEGRIEAIDFTGRKLQPTIARLIKSK